jgi:hypothetical protein
MHALGKSDPDFSGNPPMTVDSDGAKKPVGRSIDDLPGPYASPHNGTVTRHTRIDDIASAITRICLGLNFISRRIVQNLLRV